MKLDLHCHSTYSDGTLDPEDLVQAAHQVGITHMALSDHDSTSGLEAAREKGKQLGVQVIPAIEINTQETTTSVHVLGYFIEENTQSLKDTLVKHRQIRAVRTQAILDKLAHMGIKIAISDFKGRDGAAIGRPHIADKLKEKGVVFSRKEAFDKYLAKGKSAYVFYQGPTPKEAIETILAAKGVPVVAHPGYYVPETAIKEMADMGLQGIEVYYPTHSPDQVRNFLNIAKKYNMLVTGGSDYHGPGSGHEALGEVDVPNSILNDLLERKQKLFA